MSILTIAARRSIRYFRSNNYNMVKVTVTNENGKFRERSLPFQVTVSDGSTEVNCFIANLSQNRKVLEAFFTTDAFNVFSGLVDVSIVHGTNVPETITGVDINAILAPMPANFAALGLPDADNAWLATL